MYSESWPVQGQKYKSPNNYRRCILSLTSSDTKLKKISLNNYHMVYPLTTKNWTCWILMTSEDSLSLRRHPDFILYFCRTPKKMLWSRKFKTIFSFRYHDKWMFPTADWMTKDMKPNKYPIQACHDMISQIVQFKIFLNHRIWEIQGHSNAT